MREAFNIVRTGPGVNSFADIGFFLQINLCVSCDPGREVGGQRNGFVKGIGVQDWV
jgi:hypothetical protein